MVPDQDVELWWWQTLIEAHHDGRPDIDTVCFLLCFCFALSELLLCGWLWPGFASSFTFGIPGLCFHFAWRSLPSGTLRSLESWDWMIHMMDGT